MCQEFSADVTAWDQRDSRAAGSGKRRGLGRAQLQPRRVMVFGFVIPSKLGHPQDD